jgi:hypothetical protein
MDSEKSKILEDLELLVEQQKTLLREKARYESILKIILKEKESSTNQDFIFNLQDLLHKLLEKVNLISDTNSIGLSSDAGSFLEGALQAVQEQNSALRAEISQLKDELSAAKAVSAAKITEVEATNEEALNHVGRLTTELKEKDDNLLTSNREAEKRYNVLQDLHQAVTHAKVNFSVVEIPSHFLSSPLRMEMILFN